MASPQRTPSRPKSIGDYGTVSIETLQSELGASKNGLNQPEAQARLSKYGYNELPEEKTNPLLKFLSYFWGPIPWMIEVAAILSAVVHHWEDFGIILALLLMNASVGFWEEYQAGNAIAALKAKLALHAHVKRDGAWTTIPARELVPGLRARVVFVERSRQAWDLQGFRQPGEWFDDRFLEKAQATLGREISLGRRRHAALV
jgi:H+-transporting ATPase